MIQPLHVFNDGKCIATVDLDIEVDDYGDGWLTWDQATLCEELSAAFSEFASAHGVPAIGETVEMLGHTITIQEWEEIPPHIFDNYDPEWGPLAGKDAPPHARIPQSQRRAS